MVLCHELGHLYGKEPWSDEYNRKSVEGQADYWGAQVCLPTLLRAIPSESLPAPIPPTIQRRCLNDQLCIRALLAAARVGLFLANNHQLPVPQFDTPDPTVFNETFHVHPSPQCRLDTYLAGFFNRSRPHCWFAE